MEYHNRNRAAQKREDAMHNRNRAYDDKSDSVVQYRYSSHAEKRSQQRGISRSDTDLMLGFGKKRRRDGATIVFMDKKGDTNWPDLV